MLRPWFTNSSAPKTKKTPAGTTRVQSVRTNLMAGLTPVVASRFRVATRAAVWVNRFGATGGHSGVTMTPKEIQ